MRRLDTVCGSHCARVVTSHRDAATVSGGASTDRVVVVGMAGRFERVSW